MTGILVVVIVFGVIMITAVAGTFFFVKFHLKRRRESNPRNPVLEEVLGPLGFQSRPMGPGSKWIGRIRDVDIQLFDIASISAGHRRGSRKASAALFRIHVSYNPVGSKQSDEVFRKIDAENASSLFPDPEAFETVNRLLQPPVLLPIAASASEIQLRLDPNGIRVDRLRNILEDLVRLAEFIQKQPIH